MRPKRRVVAEQDAPDQLSERELEVIRIRWTLRYLRPRTPAERAALLRQVEERVRNLTPEQKEAHLFRCAIAQAESATKH